MKYLHLIAFFAFLSISSYAQFNITEPFKEGLQGSTLVVGGSALLTSGSVDPAGDGWLRLTDTGQNKTGYLYVDEAFPSTLGILVEFDYLSWKNSNTYTVNGADGICMILWNGAIPFGIGASGGGLGYTPGDVTIPVPGAAAAFLGVGLDELGNFSNPTRFITNAAPLGGPGIVGDAVVLRNSADSNYYYMTNYQLPTNGGITVGDDGGIDYKGISATRPEPGVFYRRVQLEMLPESGSYRIIVKMKLNETGSFVTLINYLSTTPPPPTLKIAFAGTTGSFSNFHEIRNLSITTPGNISVLKEGPANAAVGDTVTYKLTIRNNSTNPLTNISLIDSLPLNFRIISYDTISGNGGSVMNNIDTSNAGLLTGSCNIAANESMILRVSGYFDASLPVPGSYRNMVYLVSPSGFTDTDPTNDTAVINTLLSGPLPLDILSFTGKAYQGFNRLSWLLAKPEKNRNFRLEYSKDGKTFMSLANIPVTPEKNQYQYDHTPAFTKTYYRLAEKKEGGFMYYSNILSLQQVAPSAFKIWPNPFKDQINVSCTVPIVSLTIIDIMGKVIFSKRYDTTNDILLKDLDYLPGGVFLIRVIDVNGTIYNEKMTH